MSARFLVVLMLCVCGLSSSTLAGTTPESTIREVAHRVITNVAIVRDLPPKEAGLGLPIRLRGVVTFVYDTNHCFIQGRSSGIFVGDGVSVQHFAPGDLVLVKGVSQAGDYAPTVKPSEMEFLEHTNLPVARQVTYGQMMTGSEDSQWVEVRGRVRSVYSDSSSNCLLRIASGGGSFRALIPNVAKTNLMHLVDCEVQIKGVCATLFNKQRQLFGFWLMVPYANDVIIERRARSSVLKQPARSIASLMRFAPHSPDYGDRVKVAGTVILQESGHALFVQDDHHGLYVQSRQAGRLQPGDRVILLGYPENGNYTPVLEDATWQKVGTGPEPKPVFIHPDQALNGSVDCQLVTIDGQLLDRVSYDHETTLLLRSGQHVFSADIEDGNARNKLKDLQNGSILRLTGVCRIEVGNQWRGAPQWRAKAFHLLLRTPSDVQLLKQPPWWTLRRMLWAVGVLGVLVLVALTWIAQLRATVKQQTASIRAHLDEQEALRERYQDLFENANDIVYTHDLEGRLTSINKIGEEVLGRDRESIIHKHLLDFVSEKQRPTATVWLKRVVSGAHPAPLDLDFVSAAGEQVRLEISARLIECAGEGKEVEGIARDVTERRRLEHEILEIAKRERMRIGHDLHDGVCQQQSGIVFLADILADKLEEQHRPEVTEARRITELLNNVNKQTRNVARGLFPVQLVENGLISGLRELTESTGAFFKVQCSFHCEGPVMIADHSAANHLYYIAQEAMVNAVKHGNAKYVEVRLMPNGMGGCILTISDDGVGMPPEPLRKLGMGLRIMHYRARMIGAELEVQPRPGHGTEVVCNLPSVQRRPVD